MNKQEIFEGIKEVFDDFFDGEVEITPGTTMETCEEWESVAHIQLVFEIEEKFNIEFDADAIARMTSIEEIIRVISTKTA